MLILMALSSAVFLRRFSGRFAEIVILYFSTLTAMLFTPLGLGSKLCDPDTRCWHPLLLSA
jgi:hypothetical protein